MEVFKALIASWFDSSTRPYSLESGRKWMEDLFFCFFSGKYMLAKNLDTRLSARFLDFTFWEQHFFNYLVKISMQIGFSTVKRLARDLRHYRYYLDVLQIRQKWPFSCKVLRHLRAPHFPPTSFFLVNLHTFIES